MNFTKWCDLEINLTPFHFNGFNGVIYVNVFFNEYVPSGKLTLTLKMTNL